MAKGDAAKSAIAAKIKAALGSDFICEESKKLYCWANDGGERVQIAIALTCPKTFIDVANSSTLGDYDWSVPVPAADWTAAPAPALGITQEERDRVAMLLEKLNL